MPVLLNIHFSFFCRTTHKDKGGKSPIVIRIIFESERRDIVTGLYCVADDWDNNARRVSRYADDATATNSNLDIILRDAHNAFDALRFARDAFSIDDFVNKLFG
jgi:hypothetical protein